MHKCLSGAQAGEFGNVYFVERKDDGGRVAVKRVQVWESATETLQENMKAAGEEVRRLVCLRHENIVQCHAGFFQKYKKRPLCADLFVQMERLDMTLHDFLQGKGDFRKIFNIINQVDFGQAREINVFGHYGRTGAHSQSRLHSLERQADEYFS